MNKKCKNCGEFAQSNYCSNCGQSTETGRIDLHYLSHEIQHSVFHVDRGILYTIKELLTRPGYTIKNYLDGKRVNYFKPFAFVVILSTIYGFIAHFFDVYPESSIMLDMGNESARYNQMTLEWLYSHYSMAMLFLSTFSALSSYLIFRKSGYNYLEHLVIYSYIVGIQIFLFLLSYIFYYNFPSIWIIYIVSVLAYSYNVWVLFQLFNDGSWVKTIVKVLVCFVLSMLMIFAVSLVISFFIIIFFHKDISNLL